MIENLPQPKVCPFCSSKWRKNGECSNCYSKYKTTLTIWNHEDWHWDIEIELDGILYNWFSDKMFFINNCAKSMDYFPDFNITRLQTIFNFS